MSSDDDLLAELEKLKAENEVLRQQTKEAKLGGFRLNVSDKGAVEIEGLAKTPVKLYKDQLMKIIDNRDLVVEFIRLNNSSLVNK